jgi:hypothetical protein
MSDFIEQRIIKAVRGLLIGRVNEILREDSLDVPIIEFGNCGRHYHGDGYGMVPVIALSLCECSEKERIIRLEAYTVSITFSLPETFESETQCYAYCAAVCRAVKETPTLGGVVDRVTITGEKYTPPKKPGCGDGWGVVLMLRVTVEGSNQ